MAAQLVGAQLQTYNNLLPYTTSTTSGTSGLIVYGTSVDLGITTAAAGPNTNDTGAAYTGITHFKNVSGKDGLYVGVAGTEIPIFDKQCVQTWNTGATSAAATGWVVTPFDATISGYWTACTAIATAGAVTVAVGSAGATLMTTSAVALSIGDTVAFSQGTAGNTIVSGGTAISITTANNGTSYTGQATIVMTRVGY